MIPNQYYLSKTPIDVLSIVIRVALFGILSFFVSNCKRDNTTESNSFNSYKTSDILGDWEEDTVIHDDKSTNSIPPLFYFKKRAYQFLSDSLYEDKSCFFKFDITNRSFQFFGSTAKYTIEYDSLRLQMLPDLSWKRFSIQKLTKYSLILRKNQSTHYWLKKNYNLNPNEHFDRISVDFGMCSLPCPEFTIDFFPDGKVLYSGEEFSPYVGTCNLIISKKTYSILEEKFKKATILQLKDNYKTNNSEGQTVVFTFYKNGKIIKSISDFGRSAPNDFILAYHYVYLLVTTFSFP